MKRALSWSDLELLATLGSGQAGTVYRARLINDVQAMRADTHVAVKTYKPWVLEEPGFVERLYREVSAGRNISHPNVLQIYGAVLNANGQPALVMQLHDGTTLEHDLTERRKNDQPYGISDGSCVLREIASGITALHRAGLVHRDIKPANILLGRGGAVVADFGVVQSSGFPEQTSTGAFLGTIRYAAPEYLFGKPYDASVDLYSFGCLAYEVYSNQLTFGEHQHWAELVTVKWVEDTPRLPAVLLDTLAERLGLLATEFILATVRAFACRRESRQLSLEGFVAAVGAQAWLNSFELREGRFSPEPRQFADSFRTAAAAASSLGNFLRSAAGAHLLQMLKDGYWSNLFTQYTEPIASDLVEIGAAKMADIGGFSCLVIVDSVREAYALGLLNAAGSPTA